MNIRHFARILASAAGITAGVTLGVAVLSTSGCGRVDAGAGASSPAAVLPVGLFLEKEPEAIMTVLEAKQTAKEGDRIAVRGRIGGTRDPFVKGRAVMTIVDMSLPTCAEKADDDCITPWDYCCEQRSDIVAHAVTVQVPAEGGGPMRADLKGVGGLEPMTEVIIVGRVGQTGSPTAFLVQAEGIYVRR